MRPSAPDKKMNLERLPPDFGVQLLKIGAAISGLGALKGLGSTLKQVRLPLRDLVGVDVKLLGLLGDGQFALDGGDGL